MNYKKNIFLALQLLSLLCLHNAFAADQNKHPFYLGFGGGYGSTTWGSLVPAKDNQNSAMNLSTPINVTEGGGVWGGFIGYEFIPFFALEASYLHYPDATVFFDEFSMFSFLNDGLTEFTTHTETINLMGKFMFYIPNTSVRAFSSIGAAEVHRRDMIYDDWTINPSFGVGFNYNIHPHLMAELGANFTAGYGEAQLNPTEAYVPFLYSVVLRLAYRI